MPISAVKRLILLPIRQCAFQLPFIIKDGLQAQALGRCRRPRAESGRRWRGFPGSAPVSGGAGPGRRASGNVPHHMVEEAVADDVDVEDMAPLMEGNGIHRLHRIHGRRILAFKSRKIMRPQEDGRPFPAWPAGPGACG